MTSPTIDRVLAHCAASFDRDLQGLFTLLRQPSISAQDIGVGECATLVRATLDEAGFATRLLPTKRHPMIYGERLDAPGKPTILIYGHYDVQPPDPLDQWLSPPFEPTIRDGRIWARGVCDNKGQFFSHIAAARAWVEAVGSLPVNVKFLLEGEEETGSPHLDETVAQHRDLLAADLVYTSDGPTLLGDRPQIVYGVRGVVSLEITVSGANTDLHSGNWGGVAPNAAWRLVHLLGTMLSPENEPLIPGLTDRVRPLDDAQRAAIAAIPLTAGEMLGTVGLTELPPPAGVGLFERLMARPTITINGLTSGYQGAGGKTVIPNRASAKLDIRLVPDMDPDETLELVRAHIARVAPDAIVTGGHGMRPSTTPMDTPLAGIVREAVRTGFATEPVESPLLGGSLPDAVWTRGLGLPSFLVPYGVPDQRNHAPNENMPLDRFRDGIRTSAALFGLLADA
jgi:acetylornithine deacetylase/succinyl-diaminopimelate desuccinylase-like protein